MPYRVKCKMSALFLTLKGNIGHVPLEEGKLSVSVISQCSEVTRNQRSEETWKLKSPNERQNTQHDARWSRWRGHYSSVTETGILVHQLLTADALNTRCGDVSARRDACVLICTLMIR